MNLAKAIQLDKNLVERTRDTELVRSILSHPELFKRSNLANLDQLDPENQTDIIYLLVKNNNDIVGLSIVHTFNNSICCQIHVNYFPEYWGNGLADYSNLTLDWIFDNTDYQKVVAFAPDYYPQVKKHCEACGLKLEGYLLNSVLSDGKLDNQSIMSIEKCQQQQ